ERDQIGSSWTKRWDSFKLNSPTYTNLLPGENIDSYSSKGFISGKEFTDHLHDYARVNHLPVQQNTSVTSVNKSPLEPLFFVEVNHNGHKETWKSKQIVIASGGESQPKLPAFQNLIPKNIRQFHSSEYRNPAQLPSGSVLIIGSATSGVQIAEDLRAAHRTVYLSTSAVARVPRRYRGRDIMDWMTDLHFFEKPTSQAEDFELNMKAPLMSGVGESGHTISLQSIENMGVILLGYLSHIDQNHLTFENNLADHIGFGDSFSAQVKGGIDQFITATGMTVGPPENDIADLPANLLDPKESLSHLDLEEKNITSIIWSTGFTQDFSWINIPVLNEKGKPNHKNGITPVDGLYFMGLPWQRNLKSSLIYGTAGDAEEVTQAIMKFHFDKSEAIRI
ncbi:MAG: NAD(P)-binding domain-containing protein, partial [Saprospiraceae bacterium]